MTEAGVSFDGEDWLPSDDEAAAAAPAPTLLVLLALLAPLRLGSGEGMLVCGMARAPLPAPLATGVACAVAGEGVEGVEACMADAGENPRGVCTARARAPWAGRAP